uniref:EZH inhibitory protein n=1 Tax=Jaculus jaculus TaxID=51337 RepID=UPI001E1B02A4|nr:EZH inhibitory protein [Jaculus jaculus]
MATHSLADTEQKGRHGQVPRGTKEEDILAPGDICRTDSQDPDAPHPTFWSFKSVPGDATRSSSSSRMEAFVAISLGGENPVPPSIVSMPEKQCSDLQGSPDPHTDPSSLGTKLGSQAQVGQSPKGLSLPNQHPAKTKNPQSNHSGKQPTWDQTTKPPEGVRLQEALASQSAPEQTSTLKSRPNRRGHPQFSAESLMSTSPAFRSGATMSDPSLQQHQSSAGPDLHQLATLPDSGRQCNAPGSSPDLSGDATRTGRYLGRQATSPESGHRSTAPGTSSDRGRSTTRAGRELRRQATSSESRHRSTAPGTSSDRGRSTTRAGRGHHPRATPPESSRRRSTPRSSSDRGRSTTRASREFGRQATSPVSGRRNRAPRPSSDRGSSSTRPGRGHHPRATPPESARRRNTPGRSSDRDSGTTRTGRRPRPMWRATLPVPAAHGSASPPGPDRQIPATQSNPDLRDSVSGPGSTLHQSVSAPRIPSTTRRSRAKIVSRSRSAQRRSTLPPGQAKIPSSVAASRKRIFGRNSSQPQAKNQSGWHAVRMRASSPSPPGRYFPLVNLRSESSSSSASPLPTNNSSPSSSDSMSSDQSSRSSSKFGGLSSISTPSPDSLQRALMPDLDALSSASLGGEKETGNAPGSSTPFEP